MMAIMIKACYIMLSVPSAMIMMFIMIKVFITNQSVSQL